MDEAENSPESSEQILAVLERAGVPFARLDTEGRVLSANPDFARACGRPRGELLGISLVDLTHEEDRQKMLHAVESLVRQPDTTERVALRLSGTDGETRILELDLGTLGGSTSPRGDQVILCVARDRTSERRRNRSERRSRVEGATASTTDRATGVPNRKGLDLLLSSAARHAGRTNAPFAVLRCELALPTEPTDPDGMARACVDRLRQRLRSADSVTRLDDGVLVVVAEDLDDEQDAAGVAYRLLSTMIEPLPHEGGEIPVAMAIGIAMADGTSLPNSLLAAATQAAAAAEPGGFRMLDMRGLDSI